MLILHPKVAYFFTDTPEMDSPLSQAFSFWGNDVFVQHVHAARRRFSARSSSDSRAISMVSAMASRLRRPP